MFEKLKYWLGIFDFEKEAGKFSVKQGWGRFKFWGELNNTVPDGVVMLEGTDGTNNYTIYVGKKRKFFVDAPIYGGPIVHLRVKVGDKVVAEFPEEELLV